MTDHLLDAVREITQQDGPQDESPLNDEERLETAIRQHALSEWSEFEIEGIVQYVADIDDDDRDDPSHVAHALWQMGARGPKHKKCSVEDESSYENRCEPCQAFLLELAAKIIATAEQEPCHTPTPEEKR
jgi:hypothetical protein